jgi:hypothetical protein
MKNHQPRLREVAWVLLKSECVSGFDSRARNGANNSNCGDRNDALEGSGETRGLGKQLHLAICSRAEAQEQRQDNRRLRTISQEALRRLLCRLGLRQAADGQHGDVVFLSEVFGGFGHVEGGLIAEIVYTVEAEDLTGRTSRLNHAIGH